MAIDNLTTQATPASSLAPATVIAADKLADGSHTQLVKLLTGTFGAATPVVLAETANGLKVDGSAVTQPVSGTVAVSSLPAIPLPTGASTEATLLTRTKPADQQHVIVDSSAAIAVTGPATDTTMRASPLPVSGTVVVIDSVDLNVHVQNFPATQPVSGTFFQATQPVSLATDTPDVTDRAARLVGVVSAANLDVALSTRLKPADTLAGVTTVAAVTAITNALPVGANKLGTMDIATAAATAKGTQGANGVPIQQLHDAGRNSRIFMLDAITAAPVTEALVSVVQWYSNAAVAGTTTPVVVPAGKMLRLLSWKIMYQSLATVGYAVVRVRANTAGVAVLTSPLVFSFEAGSGSGATTVAMTGGVTTETGDFPEGMEIPAAAGIGFSMAGYGPTGVLTLGGGVRFMVTAYEY